MKNDSGEKILLITEVYCPIIIPSESRDCQNSLSFERYLVRKE